MNAKAIRSVAPIAATLAVVAAVASADQLPHRKPGLWQITMQGSGGSMPLVTSKLCIDPQTEDKLMNMGQSAANKVCTQSGVKMAGNVAMTDSSCRFGTSVASSHTVTTFSGNVAYHAQTSIHYSPPFMGRSQATMIQDGKWMGTCPPDMKPGDMIAPGGMKVHLGGTTPQR